MDIPHYTQPALEHLESTVRPRWKVFEYGSGSSTMWYHARCAEIVAVEHDYGWANTVRGRAGEGVVLLSNRGDNPHPDAIPYQDLFFAAGFNLPRHHDDVQTNYHGMENDAWRGYASRIFEYPRHHFDVVVVDGMARSLCLYHADLMCSPDGIIILDNSCRWQYNDLQGYLMDRGWHRRDFWQPGHPGYCTSFFSRSHDASDDRGPRRREQGDLYHAMGW